MLLLRGLSFDQRGLEKVKGARALLMSVAIGGLSPRF
jgi:hypothetical protein